MWVWNVHVTTEPAGGRYLILAWVFNKCEAVKQSNVCHHLRSLPCTLTLAAIISSTDSVPTLNLLITIAASEGVGLNRLQLTTRMRICFGLMPAA